MKLQHTIALALIGWYLMRPPLPHLNAHAATTGTPASLSRWVVVRTFFTQKECEAHRANPWDQCIASDDRTSRKNSGPQQRRMQTAPSPEST